MKLISILIIITLNIIQAQTKMEDIQQLINQTKEKYAPDKRTAVFDISLKSENQDFILEGETNSPEAKSELIKILTEKEILAVDKIEMLPSKDLEDKIFGVINLSTANIRTSPGNSAELSNQGLLGTPITILKKGRGYFYIQTPDKYLGWADDDGFHAMNVKEFNEWNESKKIIYTDYFGFSYSEENLKSMHVSDLVYGNVLKVLEEKENFFKAEYPDKRIAFVPKEAAQYYDNWINNIQTTDENILKTAKSLMGVPYLWGGTSIKGVDCSGFTKTVYYLNGVSLPRDASQQVHVGEPVDTKNGFENLRPGDLLFFGRKATDSTAERISHVGIYISDLEFIHSSGRVRINSFDKSKENYSEYRTNGFVRAKRILTSINKNGVYSLKELQLF